MVVMDSSLQVWLNKSAEEFGDYESDSARFQAVGTFLFQGSREDINAFEGDAPMLAREEIYANLSRGVGFLLTESTPFQVLTEALLIHAVSSKSCDVSSLQPRFPHHSSCDLSDLTHLCL